MTECNACNNGLLANEIGVGICTPCLSKGHAITNIKINPATIKPEEFKKITYCGSLANATKMYLGDERRLQGENYKAVKDEYIQGLRTWVAFAVAFFLRILLIGLIMFVYFLSSET